MGLATIDPQLLIRKSTPRFTKSPSLVLIGLVLTEMQAFKNLKNLQRNQAMKSGNVLASFQTKLWGLPFQFTSDHVISWHKIADSFWSLNFIMGSPGRLTKLNVMGSRYDETHCLLNYK